MFTPSAGSRRIVSFAIVSWIITLVISCTGRPNVATAVLDHTANSSPMMMADTSTKRDKIVYMLQGKAVHGFEWMHLINELGPQAIIHYHSFDEECEACIYRNDTTYSSGKNLLLRHVLKAEDYDHVKYFVALDSDISLQCKGGLSQVDCWKWLHQTLIDPNTTDPMRTCQTNYEPMGEITTYQTCTDSQFYALRWDYLAFFYPLATHLQEKGWNLINHVMWHLMRRCFPNGFVVDERFQLTNPEHSPYVQIYGGEAQSIINSILENDYPLLGPWNDTETIFHRCSVLGKPPKKKEADKYCMDVLTSRFNVWADNDKDENFINVAIGGDYFVHR